MADANEPFQVEISQLDDEKEFARLAEAVGGIFDGNEIFVDTETGKGHLTNLPLEEGIRLRCWDFSLKSPVRLKKTRADHPEKSFNIFYILTPETFQVSSGPDRKTIKVNGLKNTLLLSSDAEIDFNIIAKNMIKVLEISVRSSWLVKQFDERHAGVMYFVNQMIGKKEPTVLLESSKASEYLTLLELHNVLCEGEVGMLFVRSKIFLLIADFFKKVSERDRSQVLGKHFHYEKIMEAEAILLACLRRSLPRLAVIARKLSISESTLKRNFKAVYGRSIYDYYLEKKMDLAKEILMSEPYNVNEVSSILGYEKVSNFIDMFKKFHGVSPGRVLKGLSSRS